MKNYVMIRKIYEKLWKIWKKWWKIKKNLRIFNKTKKLLRNFMEKSVLKWKIGKILIEKYYIKWNVLWNGKVLKINNLLRNKLNF